MPCLTDAIGPPERRDPAIAAVAIDLLVLLLFAVQHTVMARPWFNRRWTHIASTGPV